MTPLRAKMIRELELARKSPSTIRAYVIAVSQLARHYGRSPDAISPEEVREYLHYLITERKVAFSTCNQKLAGIRFFYRCVLGRGDFPLRVPAKRSGRLPEPLGRSEVGLRRLTRGADGADAKARLGSSEPPPRRCIRAMYPARAARCVSCERWGRPLARRGKVLMLGSMRPTPKEVGCAGGGPGRLTRPSPAGCCGAGSRLLTEPMNRWGPQRQGAVGVLRGHAPCGGMSPWRRPPSALSNTASRPARRTSATPRSPTELLRRR